MLDNYEIREGTPWEVGDIRPAHVVGEARRERRIRLIASVGTVALGLAMIAAAWMLGGRR